jgi:hypothetical protein
MLNKAVTLYLLVFLFVRRRDDMVVGEDDDSEKEDIVNQCRRCTRIERCYPRVEREGSVIVIYGTQTTRRATPALVGTRNTGENTGKGGQRGGRREKKSRGGDDRELR